ncbi:MAG: hypothetical protein ACI8RZ_005796 [Myxococcota bacterium]|jgi:hypothetical protein
MTLNIRQHLSQLSLASVLAAVMLAGSPAAAQDAPPGEDEAAPTPDELGWVPDFRVIGFQDRPGTGDCNRAYARYGECIELVEFMPYELIARKMPVWENRDNWKELMEAQENGAHRRKLRKQRRAVFTQWRAMSQLYAQMWEDMAYRWTSSDDIALSTYRTSGYQVLPQASDEWDLSYPGRHRVYSLPEHQKWLGSGRWLQPFSSQLPGYDERYEDEDDGIDSDADGISDSIERIIGTYPNVADSDKDGWNDGEEFEAETSATDPDDYPKIMREGEDSFYRLVKYALPDGHHFEPVPTALLKGRFALRLGVDGRLHDYDIMDADPQPSGPFFEQMFPFDNIYRGINPEDRSQFIPLVDFDRPDTQLTRSEVWDESNSDLRIAAFSDTVRQASFQFNTFYRLIGSQIAQFAMEDYTVNHMRILGALTLMRSPPGSKGDVTGLARNLVAASRSETDTEDSIKARLDSSVYSIQGGFSLSYNKIPETLLNEWIGRLDVTHPPGSDYYARLNLAVRQMLNDTIRASSTPITDLDDVYLEQWIRDNREGGELTRMRLQIKQLALQYLMEQLNQSDRDRVETYLLLDQLDETIYQGLNDNKGSFAPPALMEGLTSGSWEGVLSEHKYYTSPIPMGLGAIDPTSICTTKDGVEALGESTIGVVHVDQIFAATDGLAPNDLLWEARNNLNFLMLDNPLVNDPQVSRLVGLPDGLALFRARWVVWSGWHMFWHVEPFADDNRLVLRTGAICDDMVLTDPDLVPTVVRAGLLDGDFRPSESARWKDDPIRQQRRRDRRARQNPRDAKGADERVSEARYAGAEGEKVYGDYEYFNEAATDPDISTAAALAQTGLGLFGAGKREPNRLRVKRPDLPQSVAYVKEIVRSPLEDIATDEDGLTVVVFDSSKPSRFYGMRNLRPRTPYARNQRRVSWRRWIRMANWGLYLDGDATSDRATVVSPSYTESPSVSTDVIVPRWRRNRTWDATFAGGAGFFPMRHVQYLCNVADADLDVVADCGPGTYSDLIGFTDGTGMSERTEGFGIDFSSMATWWFWDQPRLAVEMGLEARVDFLHGGQSWIWADYNTSAGLVSPNYNFLFKPQGGLIVGLRHAPDPRPMWRVLRLSPTWGANSSDGSSSQGRYEHGIRGGLLLGPGFNGMEGTLMTELWRGISIRRRYSPWSSFTPYHPILMGNYFLRGQYAWTMIPDDSFTRSIEMIDSYTIMTGVRLQFRLKEPLPDLF